MIKGGPVMWVLLGYSVTALAIVVERLIYFMRLPCGGRAPGENMANASQRISPEAAIVQAVRKASASGTADLVRVASRVGSEQLVRMESGLRTLAWLGNTAPLLGLFGTITGMIKAFMVIEAAGGKVDAQALAGGIWEAMVTTGAGLAVAIPVLLLLHLLEGMVDRRVRSMQQAASMVLEQMPHQPGLIAHTQVHHAGSVSRAI
ncbi:MAG: MotA/TolQ/ExbB proton channel family protein [Mariprofundaceae bacterium]|nr:MotA/TolQ/ExbB proton channel family protein [Mariprofundaceae bacterium]